MKRFTTLLSAAAFGVAVLCAPLFSQTDWETVWQNFPPGYNDTGHPNYWMYKANSFTGIAYDKWNDVVYVVNPAMCGGIPGIPCPRIHAWDADSGTVATHIQHAKKYGPPGQLYVDWSVVNGGFTYAGVYGYPLFRIDLDDQGRIYAGGIGAPNGAPFRVYRWDSAGASPELLVDDSAGVMQGTAFAVRGKMSMQNGQPYDSARIFASGGKYVAGYKTNSDIMVFVSDPSPGARHKFQPGVLMKHTETGSAVAAHSIAPTGPYPTSQLYMDSNSREVVLNNQNQGPGSLPQVYWMTLNQALPTTVTGNSGVIRYFRDEVYQMPYLICADGLPSDLTPGAANENTRARVVNLSAVPLENWPPTPTPQTGNKQFGNVIGEDNYITDVDYKIWINPETGRRHLQLFVLMSKNGIGCYRTVDPMPVPVEMETFTGTVTEGSIGLRWQIASETNNRGFEVHRSYNGSNWEQIGFVAGRGTSTSTAEYTFDDPVTGNHRQVGTVSYRLRQVDFDGTFEWTEPINVYVGDAAGGMFLAQNYPNPFNPSTAIRYHLPVAGRVQLSVFNIYGERVATLHDEFRGAGMHRVEFDASALPAGTYLYRLSSGGYTLERKMALIK